MKKHIPLFDLQRQHIELKTEIFREFEKIYDKCEFTYGQAIVDFEEQFANLSETKYCLGVRSGTASLVIALKAIHLLPGDEVISTPMTFSATSDAIVLANGKPVFVDVSERDGNIDPAQIEKAIHKRKAKVKGVVLVHFHGIPCQMDQIRQLCRKHNLFLIEDASHAHGTLYKGKPVGSFGTAGCFSLYPSKTLGSLGNAGVITTNSKTFYKELRMYANHGIKEGQSKYTHYANGYNELIDNIQAMAIVVKLKYLQSWIDRKLTIALHYNKLLQELGVSGMNIPENTKPSLYVYSIRSKQREKLAKFLKEKGIDTGVYYPLPLHLQPNFKFLGHTKGDFIQSEMFAKETISLPIFSGITDTEVDYISQSLRQFFA